jgi:SAM-dependent methyltransferase
VRDFARLDAFLDERNTEVALDYEMAQHVKFTQAALWWIEEAGLLGAGVKVLDVGVGCGIAFDIMKVKGVDVAGIDLRPQLDGVICADQSFLPFDAGAFDGVWARHVLEHSPMPFFTLTEYYRVLRPGGWCYVEVPDQNTGCAHEANANHYSILSENMWLRLMLRAGFMDIKRRAFAFGIKQSDGSTVEDKYLVFLLRKPQDDTTRKHPTAERQGPADRSQKDATHDVANQRAEAAHV